MPGLQFLAVFDPPSKGDAHHLNGGWSQQGRNAPKTAQLKGRRRRHHDASAQRFSEMASQWEKLPREIIEILSRSGTSVTTNYTYPDPSNYNAYINIRDVADRLVQGWQNYLDQRPESDATLFADLEYYVAQAVPKSLFHSALADLIRFAGCHLLKIPIRGVNGSEHFAVLQDLPRDDEQAKMALMDIFQKLRSTTLWNEKTWVITARVKGSNLLLEDFVSHWYAQGHDKGSKNVSGDLQSAISKGLVPFLNEMSTAMPFSDANKNPYLYEIEWQDIVKKELGKLRLKNLYGLVCGSESLQEGPEAYGILRDLRIGRLRDLRTHLRNPYARKFIYSYFCRMLKHQYLQPGASTVQIIDIYMRIVAVFRAIDPDGTVLPRLADKVRQFLNVRDDATEIILSSMLQGSAVFDPGPGQFGTDPALQRQNQLKQSTEHFSQSVADCFDSQEHERYTHFYEGSDMNDMNWVPAPTDAGPGYQATRTQDAMAYLIKLVPTDQFITVLQRMLSERFLLGGDGSSHDVAAFQSGAISGSVGPSSFYEKETRLLNMFKNRFKDGDIKKCEIMLRDVNESARLGRRMRKQAVEDETTQRGFPGHHHAQTQPPVFEDGAIGFQVKALSREYWPKTLVERDRLQMVGGEVHHQTAAGGAMEVESDDESDEDNNADHDSDDYDPEMPDFTPPEPVRRAAESYTASYQHFKPGRRLQWYEDLGVVTVELKFADGRTGVQKCSALQAAVVYAFHDDGDDDQRKEGGKRRSVAELKEILGGRVGRRRIRDCCAWWVGVGVLKEVGNGVFEVVEQREQGSEAPTTTTTFAPSSSFGSPAGHAANTNTNYPLPHTPLAQTQTHTPTHSHPQSSLQRPHQPHSPQSPHTALLAHKSLYASKIVSLLRSHGAMSRERIKRLLDLEGVPGGFAFESAELGWFLGVVMGGGLAGAVGEGDDDGVQGVVERVVVEGNGEGEGEGDGRGDGLVEVWRVRSDGGTGAEDGDVDMVM